MIDRPHRPELPVWQIEGGIPSSPLASVAQRWLDAYVDAWRANEPEPIADLWSDDAIWYYPFGVRAAGREAITAEWMAEKHLFQPGGYDALYQPIAIDNGYVVTHGRTHFIYPETGKTRIVYDNIWLLRFDDEGRCSEFHEWYSPLPHERDDD